MRPTEILSQEHQVILRVLACLERLCQPAADDAFDADSAAQIVDFVQTFADRCHHEKEEQRLFPAMQAQGFPSDVGPIAVMLDEHEQGRALVRAMSDALQIENADAYREAGLRFVHLLRDHIGKEDGVLFPMADSVLDEAAQAKVLAEFEQTEHADLGPGTHERYLALARGLCERFGVDPDGVPVGSGGHCCGH